MAWSVTTAPAEEPVTLAEALIHLKADSSPEDSAIEGWIQAAREYVEETCEIAIMPQVWTVQCKAFPAGGGAIELPGGRVSEVTSITYLDGAGEEREMTSSGCEVDLISRPPMVSPIYGRGWPAGRRVRVVYQVGYATAGEVPERIKSAIKLIVGDLHKNRSKSVTGTIVVQNDTVGRLLRGFTRVLP